MPRSAKPRETPEKLEQNRALWEMMGAKDKVPVTSWDCKQVLVLDAILSILSTGCTVVFRPGKEGQTLGVAIWEQKLMHDPEWCNTSDELDAWADGVMNAFEVIRLKQGG